VKQSIGQRGKLGKDHVTTQSTNQAIQHSTGILQMFLCISGKRHKEEKKRVRWPGGKGIRIATINQRSR